MGCLETTPTGKVAFQLVLLSFLLMCEENSQSMLIESYVSISKVCIPHFYTTTSLQGEEEAENVASA